MSPCRHYETARPHRTPSSSYVPVEKSRSTELCFRRGGFEIFCAICDGGVSILTTLPTLRVPTSGRKLFFSLGKTCVGQPLCNKIAPCGGYPFHARWQRSVRLLVGDDATSAGDQRLVGCKVITLRVGRKPVSIPLKADVLTCAGAPSGRSSSHRRVLELRTGGHRRTTRRQRKQRQQQRPRQ